MDVLWINLLEVLLIEERYKLVKEVLAANTLNKAMVHFEKAVPCLLLVENRASECIIYHGLLTRWRYREDSNIATEEFMREIQRYVNEVLFGTHRCPTNWKFPLKHDGTMDTIKLANWRARRFVEHLDVIIYICISEDKLEERND
jgi:hypothetical protein